MLTQTRAGNSGPTRFSPPPRVPVRFGPGTVADSADDYLWTRPIDHLGTTAARTPEEDPETRSVRARWLLGNGVQTG